MQSAVNRFLNKVNRDEINFHSILITQNGETVYEEYRAPFSPEQPHRMYSVTKSFVAVGIGALIDEGKLSIDDTIASFFPDKLPDNLPRELGEQTIRHMLIMNTSQSVGWFYPGVIDRTAFYFAQKPTRPSGTLFDYDSTGSYVLGALIERKSGMKLLDYLKLKFLDKIGGFENAEILETPDGTAWGDSALLCTTRALERFARFVMQLGNWNGEQLVSREYMRRAVSCQTDNDLNCKKTYNTRGYGYQIWMTEHNGFSFHGMGGQQMICLPEQKLIFVCTGDNQYFDEYGELLYRDFFESFCPDETEYHSADKLSVAHGKADSPFADEINGAKFVCADNPMGIKWFSFDFGPECSLRYENAQGEKTIAFGMKQNVFGLFPQLGYSDGRGNVHEINGFKYRCAVSGGWVEDRKLMLRVQIIDRYFGSVIMNFGFRDKNVCGIKMNKVAEDFLNEYSGWAIAYREEN